ncbi:MAG: MFS transporter, partial [Dehalococcoidia bacterium]
MEYSDIASGTLQRDESILDNQRFRRLAIARALAQTAQNALIFALLVIVVKETGSGFKSSLFLLSIIIPSLLAGFFSGALADRLPKKLIMVVADLLRMAIAVAFFFWADNVWKIYAITTMLAVAGEARAPAESAVVPSLVPYRQLAAANALLNVTLIVGQVLGMAALAPLFLKTT